MKGLALSTGQKRNRWEATCSRGAAGLPMEETQSSQACSMERSAGDTENVPSASLLLMPPSYRHNSCVSRCTESQTSLARWVTPQCSAPPRAQELVEPPSKGWQTAPSVPESTHGDSIQARTCLQTPLCVWGNLC